SIISYPHDHATELFLEHLTGLGADLSAGRKLKVLFNRAKLRTAIGLDTETEFLLVNDTNRQLKEFEEYFWSLEKFMKKGGWKKEEIERYKREKSRQIEEGLWFGFLPAFYAIGRKE
ncbi:MAG: hypothetical protein JSW28_00460, partial [Thermoplasmata archaeon]